MDDLRKKWRWTVTVAWLVSAASILTAVYLAFKYGIYEAPGVDSTHNIVMVSKIRMGVIIGCVIQAAASILFAVMFMIINDIYENSVDIYGQNQDFLRHR